MTSKTLSQCKINNLGKYMKHAIEHKVKVTRTENPNGDWPERDHIPVDKDPIGDIDDSLEKQIDYIKRNNEGDFFIKVDKTTKVNQYGETYQTATITRKPTNHISVEGNKCTHPNKYKNIISNNLRFWACPDCGADLGDC